MKNYKAYHHEIVGNVVAYIADCYYNANKFYIYQIIMYKILALLDFTCVKELGSPCVELDFRARNMGPVPEELYNDRKFENSFSEFKTKCTLKNGKIQKQYICNCTPDLDYISPKEKIILDKIIDRFLREKINANKASDITHKEIKSWELAYKRQPNSQMLYAEEFPNNIFTLPEEELTIPEARFINYNEFANA